MNEQLNTPSREQVETQTNGSCPLCGTYIFTPMRTEVRIQLELGSVSANASFGEVLALTQM
ncbi:8658_t:CDS:2 [Paraglomus brasilianum]|uniref:8658_t:CDS:1 n=1 Tax=Paraglomus brasilianum TaxID=144538 RepID=A0A9N9DRM9_9GLOM|nr:8658_t:CDS:2 [Paraglomus brasilianum]